VDPTVYVSSPSFTLVNEYPGRFPLVHMDFYRLGHAEELAELGVEAYYRGECACLVEWFDRFDEAMPAEHLQVRLVVTGPRSRRLVVDAVGRRHADLARRWAGVACKGKLDSGVVSQLGSMHLGVRDDKAKRPKPG